jgi:sarcosine oxidase
MGSMALWQLARLGVTAIGFEQFALGHDRGAGAGETRQYRAEYLEPEVLPIMARATALYRQLEADSGMPLLNITGGLTIGPADSPLISDLAARIKNAHSQPVLLSHADMRARFPQHKLADNDVVIWHAESGYVWPEHAIVAAGTTAQRLGARIIPGTRITEIEQETGRVALRSRDSTFFVRRAILTTGPWTWDLLPELLPGGDLGRLVLTWFPVGDDHAFRPGRFPTFTRLVEGITIYGMPQITPGTVRIGLVGPRSKFTTPGELNRVAHPHEIAAISGLVGRWMPAVIPAVIRTGIHLDAYTPDGQPLIGTLSGCPDVLIAAAFSGRGFKMAPVIGAILADLATHRESGISLRSWKPDRFSAPPGPQHSRGAGGH